MQGKLKNEQEEQALTSRINRLNDMRAGTPKPKDGGSSGGSGAGGGGTGLIGTWKKLKGKKKKQRNLTAPEISTQDIKVATVSDEAHRTSTSTLVPVIESEKKEGKGKARFGRKQSRDKTSLEPKDLRCASSAAEIVFKNELADSPLLPEEASLSQMSAPLASGHIEPPASDINATPSPAKSSDMIVLEPLDLSQTSGKHSGASLSQTDPFAGIDEHLNTQSSSETAMSSSLIGAHQSSEGWNDKVASKDDIHYEGSNFQGSSRLYEDYGSKQHRLNLERVHTFLESSGEMEPADLNLLQDWDGWMVASRDIM